MNAKRAELSFYDTENTNVITNTFPIKGVDYTAESTEVKLEDGTFVHGPPMVKITLTPDM